MGLVEGRSGLVTGAAGGLGRATALCLAQEGAAGVLVVDLEAQHEAAEETVAMVEAAGARAVFAPADVADEADQQRLVQTCVAEFGRLDFAHNNAGIDTWAPLEETTVEDWTRVIDVNLKGTFLGLKHQLPQMREQRGGAIVNTASLAGIMGVPNLSAYIASKHGVVGLTKAAALEAGAAGIRVNCVCPTVIRTQMIERLDPELQERLIRPHAIKRLGEASEIGETVTWLLSDRASLITGAILPADLGHTAGIYP